MGRILIVIDSLGIGGAERVALTLSKGFYEKGYNIDLVSIDNIIKFDIPDYINLHILDFKKEFLDYFRYRKKLHNLIDNLQKKIKFDLILVNLQKSTRLIKNYKHPKIFHIIHSTFSQSALKNKKWLKLYFRKRKLQKIYNNLNIIAVSNGIKNDLISIIGIKPKSIQTIYNPIDFNEIIKKAKEKNIINEKNYIIHIGRFDKVKRHDILLKSYKKSNINAKLVLVGDGNQKENILKFITELNLQNKVILTGFIKNPYPILKQAKLFVLSSEYEGLPTVLLEALSLNIPVISTNCPSGPSEIMIDNLSKYLVENKDIDALSQMINFVYNNPYKIPNHLIDRFNLSTITSQYLELIK